MHVVQAQHDLVNDVHCLALCEAAHLGEALEELTTFNQFGDYVIVVIVL